MDKYKRSYHKLRKQYNELKNNNLKISYGKDYPKFIIENTFPLIKDVDRDNTEFNENTIRLMAGNNGIKLISDAIEQRMGSNITITNVTPNFGSDLLNMAFRFQKIITIDEGDISLLKHNIDLYDLSLRVKIINDSVIKSLKKTEQEIIYIDGYFLPNKTIDTKKRIYMDDIEISKIVDLYKERSKMFVFRIPIDYDFNYMFTEISSTYYEIIGYKKDKISRKTDFYFIIVMSKMI